MLKRGFQSIATTWFAGLLALLPLALSLALLGWLVSLLDRLMGPHSALGRLFTELGQSFVSGPLLAWLLSIVALIVVLYPLGLAVQLGLKKPLRRLLDHTLRRIPLFGNLYGLADRFVGLLDQKDSADLAAMSPVWCFFGGDGTAVLALLPNPQPILIEERAYHAILVPTAPVPVGGGLLYVPVEWVKPAHMGMDRFTSIYVSMGITPPGPISAAQR